MSNPYSVQNLIEEYYGGVKDEHARDETILDSVMAELYPTIRGLTRKKINYGEHEDIAQKALIRLTQFLRKENAPPRNIIAVCTDLTKKTIADYYRSAQTEKDKKKVEVEEQHQSKDPWDQLEAREKLALILDYARNHCSNEHFQVILMLWKLGMTHAEAAEHVNLTPAAVQSIEYRFKKKLLEYLERKGII